MRGQQVIDCVTQHTGLRSFSVDAERGFMLNGRPYPLYGFNRHEDFKGYGSAMGRSQHETDMQLIMESGATMVRLSHYPQGETIYNLSDERGIVLWSEIALCGPGGYDYTGYVNNVADNARQTLHEMVYQKMNHPSVCFWGIFNEVLVSDGKRFREYDDPLPMIRELNDLYHRLDPTRLTTFATCVDQTRYLGCSDLIAWNKYTGWKNAETDAAKFFDNARRNSGGTPVGAAAAPCSTPTRCTTRKTTFRALPTPKNTRLCATRATGGPSRSGRGCGLRPCGSFPTCSRA